MPKLISISEIIKTSWQLCTANWQKLTMPVLFLIASYLLLIISQIAMPALLFLFMVIFILISLWASVLLILAINKILQKQSFEINTLYKPAASLMWPYFLVGLLAGLIVIGGLILLIIPGIIFAVWYAFAEYIVVIEKDKKVMSSLKESKMLVNGRWAATFWRLVIPPLLVYIITIVAFYIVSVIFRINPSSFENAMLINALSTIVLLALMPLLLSFSIILYKNLKETR